MKHQLISDYVSYYLQTLDCILLAGLVDCTRSLTHTKSHFYMLLNNSNLTVTVTCLALCNLFPACMDSNTSEGLHTLNMHVVHGFLLYISVLEHQLESYKKGSL